MNIRRISLRFMFMFLAVLIFTFFDWLVHQSSPYLAVPSWYFTNKIIYGTLWAFLASLIFRKTDITKQAATITSITVVLLQIRYVLYGYSLFFHTIVLIEHLIFLYLTSLFALKLLSRFE